MKEFDLSQVSIFRSFQFYFPLRELYKSFDLPPFLTPPSLAPQWETEWGRGKYKFNLKAYHIACIIQKYSTQTERETKSYSSDAYKRNCLSWEFASSFIFCLYCYIPSSNIHSSGFRLLHKHFTSNFLLSVSSTYVRCILIKHFQISQLTLYSGDR